MADFDFSQTLGEARTKYDSISKALDIDRLNAQIAELSKQAAEPGLWDDPEHAQKVTCNVLLRRSKIYFERSDSWLASSSRALPASSWYT